MGVLEGRWKASQGLGPGSDAASAAETAAWGSSAQQGASHGQQLHMTAEFSSLQEWQDMRSRIGSLQGVSDLQVGALSARGAEISFAYSGEIQALQQQLATIGLGVVNDGGRAVVRRAN
jgi:hypothetical protein